MKIKCKHPFSFSQVIRALMVSVFLSSLITPVVAQGDLLIYPKRVVFEGRTKVEKLTLANIGADTAVYNISFLEYKMDETGAMKIITDPEEGIQFASSHVRFFPRKVMLGPGESQIVKVQLRNAQDLPDGEYRSHLYFRAKEDKGALGNPEEVNDSTIEVSLKAVYGISLACIVRKGENTTAVNISDLKFEAKGDILDFNLNRSGNMSAYGDFIVTYVSTDKREYEVAKIKGVGVYTPGLYRNIKMQLTKPDGVTFSGGILKVDFTENGRKKVLAKAELEL